MAPFLRIGNLFLLSFVIFLTVDCHILRAEALTSEHGFASSAHRHLLQAKKSCAVQFSTVDFSPIISKCDVNSTATTQEGCCEAFTAFFCIYANLLNDGTTKCADEYFAYLQFQGHFPQGYFANTCNKYGDGVNGIPCPLTPAPAPAPSSSEVLQFSWVPLIIGVGVYFAGHVF